MTAPFAAPATIEDLLTLDDDIQAEAYYARQERNAHRCQCGNPDWPGSCPGPANCPCCQSDCDEGDA
jgi:hypothetical protein